MHFGLIPRTNRGIFAINELPDLAPRIQVGLFNVLEERDVQIRGYPDPAAPGRLPGLQRQPGGLHQPRPDRHAAQGPHRLGHPHALPADASRSRMQITQRERLARRANGDGRRGSIVPQFMAEIVEEIVRLARTSPHVNQQSGVSVRHRSPAWRRWCPTPSAAGSCSARSAVVPRISDLANIERQLPRQDRADAGRGRAGRGQADPVAARRGGQERGRQLLRDGQPRAGGQQFQGGKTNVEVGDDVRADALVAVSLDGQGADQGCGRRAAAIRPARRATPARWPARWSSSSRRCT